MAKQAKTKVNKSLRNQKSSRKIIYFFLISTLAIIFLFSLFKNISYPLIWNDESESITMAQQVLKYGYPKVHDGRNIFFLPEEKTWIGYKKDGDMPIGNTWGYYYFGTIGVVLSDLTQDIFLKTALVRLPFALAGALGLFLFLLPFKKIISPLSNYYLFITLFIITETLSISLLLHIREARYYSLVILMCGWFFNVFVNHFILKKYSFLKYSILMTLVLIFTYHTYYIFFAILLAVTGMYATYYSAIKIYQSYLKKNIKHEIKNEVFSFAGNISPLIISGVSAIPFLIYYEVFETSAKASANYNFTMDMFFAHLDQIFAYLSKLEFMNTAIVVKIIYAIGWIMMRQTARTKDKSVAEKIKLCDLKEKISFFLVGLIVIYSLVISRLPFLFVRHFIVLQPLLTLMMVLDFIIILDYINIYTSSRKAVAIKFLIPILCLIVFISNAQNKIPYVKEHIYEMNHQRKGPLDVIIPYIKEKYPATDSLLIATNYEELCYVYYLNCITLLGYNYKNLDEDLKKTPDVLIFRKKWGHDPAPFNQYMQKARYERISFPVYDSPVNNIPELDWFFTQHLFRTKFTNVEQDKTEIWVRVNSDTLSQQPQPAPSDNQNSPREKK